MINNFLCLHNTGAKELYEEQSSAAEDVTVAKWKLNYYGKTSGELDQH